MNVFFFTDRKNSLIEMLRLLCSDLSETFESASFLNKIQNPRTYKHFLELGSESENLPSASAQKTVLM